MRALSLACRGRPRAVSSRGLSQVCQQRASEPELSSKSPVRTLTLSDQGPTLMTLFNVHDFLRGPISNYGHTGDPTLEYLGITNM